MAAVGEERVWREEGGERKGEREREPHIPAPPYTRYQSTEPGWVHTAPLFPN